ncbi:MAG: error-prone DNA polymerase [Alphaproteobacteria bacterium]|nr:error-prone DNA polymerase [Alphaproteobacteria bacterium]
MTAYVELQVTSNFSFLRGASHPEELASRAAALGHPAMAITDRNSLAGAVRAHVGCKAAGIRPVIGARLDFTDGPSVLAFPTDRAAYGRLARLLTLGRRRAPKGECCLQWQDLFAHGAGQLLVALAPDRPGENFILYLKKLKQSFDKDCFIAAQNLLHGDHARRLEMLADLAEAAGLPLVATNDVHMHDPARRPLQDVLTCIREGCTLETAGYRLFPNGERHLKSAAAMAALFRDHPEAVARSHEIAERAAFSLDELRYEYPVDTVPDGWTEQEQLERLVHAGAQARYPGGVPERVRAGLDHELALIGQLNYASYFLTVHDIVRFARDRDILCQGRGSAANSAVCYCLGITAVDPAKHDLLFERFVSAERNEPPDIDVDFEHERREEVLQYVYRRYGRHRAGLAATVISYRARSAIREVGKVLGLSEDMVGALSGTIWGWSSDGLVDAHIREIGLDPTDRTLRQAVTLANEIIGFPRHLSQHVGGFVITRGPLEAVVPIENAAMEDRTVVQWDKDDLDALGILKIDLLGLGMLTCIRKGFDLLARHYGRDVSLATVPAEDPAVYDMLCKADSIGVFQVESRAQMSMLPRLRPRCYYDLVIEVAIVRPGPIQGDMVHPYLRRRSGQEPVEFPSEELRQVLEKTCGVPLFQEQAMRIAIVAAGFTPTEADGLRRAMATFRKTGTIHNFHDKMIDGMVARGYDRAFAERCFKQIEGFGEYGFPESHAASFALLVYVSSWLKCHYPAVFACALLNSQPMGFYAPAQIVRDAREHGVEVRPADVNLSDWDCTLEPDATGGMALRLGLRQIKGLGEQDGERLAAARGNGYLDPRAVWRRAGLKPAVLEKLAAADAFASMGLERREALWAVKGLGPAPMALFAAMGEDREADEAAVRLPPMAESEQVIEDYAALRLTLRRHPLAFLRASLAAKGIVPCAALAELPVDRRVSVAGLVLVRQRPGSAKGVIFMTVEDETSIANIIVWPPVFERYRRIVLGGRLLAVTGKLQRESGVIHVVADRLTDLSHRLAELGRAHGLEPTHARADEVKRPGPDPYDGPGIPPRGGPARRLPRSRDFH